MQPYILEKLFHIQFIDVCKISNNCNVFCTLNRYPLSSTYCFFLKLTFFCIKLYGTFCSILQTRATQIETSNQLNAMETVLCTNQSQFLFHFFMFANFKLTDFCCIKMEIKMSME